MTPVPPHLDSRQLGHRVLPDHSGAETLFFSIGGVEAVMEAAAVTTLIITDATMLHRLSGPERAIIHWRAPLQGTPPGQNLNNGHLGLQPPI